jgi:hypothetical protein
VVSLEFEYKGVVANTNFTAEIHDIGEGWWRYFLTENGLPMSGVHEVYLPGIPLTHEHVARIAHEIELAKRLDT